MRQSHRLQNMIDFVAPHFQQRGRSLVTFVHFSSHGFAFLVGGGSTVVLFERNVPHFDGFFVGTFFVVGLFDSDIPVLYALNERSELLFGADLLHMDEKEAVGFFSGGGI